MSLVPVSAPLTDIVICYIFMNVFFESIVKV